MNEPSESDDIFIERNMNQNGLISFVENLKGNSFSEVVFEQTESLQKKLNKRIEDYIKNQGESYIDDAYYLHLDTEFLEDKLSALSEMNIVYAYKNFEINFKKLISVAYGISIKEFYKWESIINFLKSKGIKPSELEGFQQVNDLRKLNNHIKHSTSRKIDNKIKSIAEFSKEEYLEHNSLSLFYKRIKNVPYTFLDNISTEIYKNLYEFDSNRIKSIAKKMALRMEKESAMKLIKELNKLY